MKIRSLLVLVVLCLLLPGAPSEKAEAIGNAGAVIHFEDGLCYWQCYNIRKAGVTPVNPPSTSACMYLCADKCGGPCDALY
jgi:hypothetical protein